MKSTCLGRLLGTSVLMTIGLVACGDDEASNPGGGDDTSEQTEDETRDGSGDSSDDEDDASEGSDDTGDDSDDRRDGSDDTSDDSGGERCPDLDERSEVEVSGEISSNTRWTCDKTYILTDLTYVVDDTALTIEPGTVIRGQERAALVITRGSRLVARGTRAAPIVFTSDLLEGERGPGDWGGVALLGAAPINAKGGIDQVEGIGSGEAYGEYGGDDEEHDCGHLRYVRVEFAGYELSVDNELNGISVAGCGSNTLLEYVQVHRGSDDGIEFWGGAARVRYLVVSGSQDDSIDWDAGYRGKMQFVVVQQHDDGDAIIEGDNNADDNDATPRSNPTIYNATLVGGGGNGVVLRAGTWGIIRNAILTNGPYAVDVRDAASAAGAERDPVRLAIDNSLFFDNGGDGTTHFRDDDNAGGFDDAAFFTDAARSNRFDVDPELEDIASRMAPSFLPADGSPAAEGAATPPDDGFFDPAAEYIGAFEPGGEDWTQGWTAYPRD